MEVIQEPENLTKVTDETTAVREVTYQPVLDNEEKAASPELKAATASAVDASTLTAASRAR